jgi:membrane protein
MVKNKNILYIIIKSNNIQEIFMVTREIKCRYCQGYGFIKPGETCPICGGSGKIEQTDFEIGKTIGKAPSAIGALIESVFIIFQKPLIFFIPGLIIYIFFKDNLRMQLDTINGALVVGSFLHILNIFSKKFGNIHKIAIAISLILFGVFFLNISKIQYLDPLLLYIAGFLFVNFISFYKTYFNFIKYSIAFAFSILLLIALLLTAIAILIKFLS